jgi:glucosamine--fructose-6-phosphate aminotransferase (isomerizing)
MTAMPQNPRMLQEVRESPDVVARILSENSGTVKRLAIALRERQPRFAMTIARGSSDHAAAYLKYALETRLGVVTASGAPSVVTVYGSRLRLQDALVIAISQSGQSPDVVGALAAAREAGAMTVAVVNEEGSPLEQAAEFCLPMRAGPEKAVAATKTYVASLVAPLQVLAAVAEDDALITALAGLPSALRAALGVEEEAARRAERYRYADGMVTLARGPHFPIALELALKFKETCRLRAEAFSAAEFAHGPIILVEHGFPILAFQARDASGEGTRTLYKDLAARGAELVLVGDTSDEISAAVRLPTPPTGHLLTDPVAGVLAGYLFAGHLALARGLDPDAPRSLTKVTRTL